MKYIITLFVLLVTINSNASKLPTFEEQVDMTPWSNNVAVFTNGRVKSFETFARSFMPHIMGPRSFNNQSPTFTYFDMLIRPERYVGEAIIYVKHKGVRAAIIGVIDTSDPLVKESMDTFMETGLVSREVLQDPSVRSLFGRMRQDVRRFATPIETIDSGVGASDPRTLWVVLKVIPPKSGSFEDQWTTIGSANVKIEESWSEMQRAWKLENASGVNEELKKLAV
ncbi:MAG: hypothetical protein ACKVIO_08270, partial [Phycisphaerales bacterium]